MNSWLKKDRRVRGCVEIILANLILKVVFVATPLFDLNILSHSSWTILVLAFFAARLLLMFILPGILFSLVWDKISSGNAQTDQR